MIRSIEQFDNDVMEHYWKPLQEMLKEGDSRMNDDYLDALTKFQHHNMPIHERTLRELSYKEKDPLTVTYEIQMGDDIPLKFIMKGIICIEVLNKRFTRIITNKGKVGISVKDRRDYYDYDFGVSMAYTRAIDNDNGLDFQMLFSDEVERYELSEPETKSEKKDMYKLIMYYIGDNPLTKDVQDYESMILEKGCDVCE